MDHSELINYRLATQHISGGLGTPEEVLNSMGAMQAQDYPADLSGP